jgi:transcriptional regulator with XRE-family HTH domain
MAADRIRKLFGPRLRRARVAHGMTQEQLAGLSGLSVRFVAALERGERFPSLEAAARLYEALGYPSDGLLLPEEPEPSRRRGKSLRSY